MQCRCAWAGAQAPTKSAIRPKMTMSRETYRPGYSDATLRLMLERTAAKHAAFFTPFLERGMRLLDCGCGPGTITTGLAKLVSPGQVFGIDLEPGQVRRAQDRARQKQSNASFEVAGIYALPFPDGHFDGVFAHALFEHLREPVRALREMKRVLRSSGLVGIRSPDWAGWVVHPMNAPLEEAFRLFKEIQIANGGNPLRWESFERPDFAIYRSRLRMRSSTIWRVLWNGWLIVSRA